MRILILAAGLLFFGPNVYAYNYLTDKYDFDKLMAECQGEGHPVPYCLGRASGVERARGYKNSNEENEKKLAMFFAAASN